VLSTQGRSFWILDNLTPLHQLRNETVRGAHLVRPRETVRFRYSAGFGGAESARSTPDQPQFPPSGAMIDYWLADTTQTVTLEIRDAAGNVVRSFSSGAAGERTQPPAEPGMRAPTLERVGTPRLPRQSGMNRFVWDLAHPGSWSENAQRSGRGGPLAVPGTYTVRLSVGDRTMTEPLTIRMDPRVARDGVTQAELEEQLAHSLRVRDMVSEVNRLVARVQAAKKGATGQTLQQLTALERLLVAEPVRYGRPGLQTQITYLYGLTTQADQRIGRDAVERYQTLRGELDAAQAEARAVQGS
ncbi:MAG: hypothetical protein M3434_13485, partial [Gemmatimonadota bacterium]|nr:hypothetical protein [Gemmatimonadota bacterium]